jgi:hypothetical protein
VHVNAQEGVVFAAYRVKNPPDLVEEMRELVAQWKTRDAEAAGILLMAPEVVEKINNFYVQDVLPYVCGLPCGDTGREWQRVFSPAARGLLHTLFAEVQRVVADDENINPYLLTTHQQWLGVAEAVKKVGVGGRSRCDDFIISQPSNLGRRGLGIYAALSPFLVQTTSRACLKLSVTFSRVSRVTN